MAIRCLNYVSCHLLPCAKSFPSEVVLCVTTTKVALHDCEDDTPETYQYRHITAILTSVTNVGCNTGQYRYEFCYDDEQITEGQTLFGSDINGVFCKDCFTNWVEDLVGNDPFMRSNEDGSITFVNNHGCEFTFWPGEEPIV